MKIVSAEELISYKILPFNIYSEFGEKLFAAGEVLTPGKLLQLRHMNSLYRDDEVYPQAALPQALDATPVANDKSSVLNDVTTSAADTENSKPPIPPHLVIETFEMSTISTISPTELSIDDIDILNYRGPINKKAKIDPRTQIKIKAFYNKILETMDKTTPADTLGMFANVRDKIVHDIVFGADEVVFCSQLKLLGEYNKCHALNTAILSGTIAKKMDLSETQIQDIVLGGLLHDIGKTKIDQELLDKPNPTNVEQKKIQSHTTHGYRILRHEMKLPDNIAEIALEHHENNDGSGYPHGKSGDWINIESRIVSVCNYFDNLTFNRTLYKIHNAKEALRVMLELGSKRFSADVLYTFAHMFSYNDTTNFEEMVL